MLDGNRLLLLNVTSCTVAQHTLRVDGYYDYSDCLQDIFDNIFRDHISAARHCLLMWQPFPSLFDNLFSVSRRGEEAALAQQCGSQSPLHRCDTNIIIQPCFGKKFTVASEFIVSPFQASACHVFRFIFIRKRWMVHYWKLIFSNNVKPV